MIGVELVFLGTERRGEGREGGLGTDKLKLRFVVGGFLVWRWSFIGYEQGSSWHNISPSHILIVIYMDRNSVEEDII